MSARIELYEDKAGEFRWRKVADNGEITASSEGYTRKWDAREAAEREQNSYSEFLPIVEGNAEPQESDPG